MEATELMIGDLVRVNKDVSIKSGTIVRVRSIDGERRFQELAGCATCVPIDDPDEMSGGVWLKYLEPIPMTPEILEQNGWKKVPQLGCANPFRWQLEKYEDDIHDEARLLYRIMAYETFFRGMLVSIAYPSACESISFRKQIEHVHELQHALRLCSINKEIIL